jgi:DNA primase
MNWLHDLLNVLTLSSAHQHYLNTRGVDDKSNVEFRTLTPDLITFEIPCERFKTNFGKKGEKLKDCLIIPATSARNEIYGFEARSWDANGNKRVFKYMLDKSQWLPSVLNAHELIEALWSNGDIYFVEGVFDMVALKKVIDYPNAVVCTMRAGLDDLTIDMVQRFYHRMTTIYMTYDNDATGRMKSNEAIFKLKKLGIRAVESKYRGKDPNDLWAIQGEQGLKKYFLF